MTKATERRNAGYVTGLARPLFLVCGRRPLLGRRQQTPTNQSERPVQTLYCAVLLLWSFRLKLPAPKAILISHVKHILSANANCYAVAPIVTSFLVADPFPSPCKNRVTFAINPPRTVMHCSSAARETVLPSNGPANNQLRSRGNFP